MKLFGQDIFPDHFKQLETFLRGTGPDIWARVSSVTSEAEKPINTSERRVCCWNLRGLVNGCGALVFSLCLFKNTRPHTLCPPPLLQTHRVQTRARSLKAEVLAKERESWRRAGADVPTRRTSEQNKRRCWRWFSDGELIRRPPERLSEISTPNQLYTTTAFLHVL